MRRHLTPIFLMVILATALWQGAFAQDKKATPPPKVYNAAVVINNAAAPTVNELENNTGSVITINRIAAGQYRVESNPPAFTVGKTMAYTHYYNMGPSITVEAVLLCFAVDYCSLRMFSADPFGNSLYFYDGGTAGTPIPISITIYP